MVKDRKEQLLSNTAFCEDSATFKVHESIAKDLLTYTDFLLYFFFLFKLM